MILRSNATNSTVNVDNVLPFNTNTYTHTDIQTQLPAIIVTNLLLSEKERVQGGEKETIVCCLIKDHYITTIVVIIENNMLLCCIKRKLNLNLMGHFKYIIVNNMINNHYLKVLYMLENIKKKMKYKGLNILLSPLL